MSRNNTGNKISYDYRFALGSKTSIVKDMNPGFVQEQNSAALEYLLTLHISLFSIPYS